MFVGLSERISQLFGRRRRWKVEKKPPSFWGTSNTFRSSQKMFNVEKNQVDRGRKNAFKNKYCPVFENEGLAQEIPAPAYYLMLPDGVGSSDGPADPS